MPTAGSIHCPCCGSKVATNSPMPFGIASCQSCGRELFFLTINGTLTFFRHSDATFVRWLFDAISHHQRLPPTLHLDSLHTVELILEFESALKSAE